MTHRWEISTSAVVTVSLPFVPVGLFWTLYFKRDLYGLELIPEEHNQMVRELRMMCDEDFLNLLVSGLQLSSEAKNDSL